MSLSLGERDGINKTVWTFCSRARNGLAPMHLCAQEDRVNVAAILAARGAELDAETKAGYTPLHVASHFGQMAMVRFLLEHGVRVDVQNELGYSPLHQVGLHRFPIPGINIVPPLLNIVLNIGETFVMKLNTQDLNVG